jgi:NAD-dependent SIR2 family protein deacetylase
MGKKRVIVSTCDNCGTEVVNDDVVGKGALVLPDFWITISVKSRSKDLFESDLCGECKVPVLKVLGKK